VLGHADCAITPVDCHAPEGIGSEF
jgi:hypothetical protein